MSRKTILVMFSGGIDSTYILHKILTAPEYSEYDVHVHHMRLINKENRAIAEEIAVKNIVDYFRKNNYRSFVLSFTDLKYPNKIIFRDTYAISMVSGKISGEDPSIEFVAIGTNSTDILDSSLAEIIAKANNIFTSLTKAKKIYPAIKMSKFEVRDALPKSLIELTWSCRTPKYLNGVPIKCQKCKTCKQLGESK